MKKLLTKLSLFLPLILAFDCGKDNPPVSSDSTNFMLVNSNFESVVGNEVGTATCPATRYHSDSLKAFDQAGGQVYLTHYTSATDPCNSLITLPLGRAGIMNKDDFEVTYFLHLDAMDVDTIRIVGRGQLPNQMYLNGAPAVQSPPTIQTRTSYYLVK